MRVVTGSNMCIDSTWHISSYRYTDFVTYGSEICWQHRYCDLLNILKFCNLLATQKLCDLFASTENFQLLHRFCYCSAIFVTLDSGSGMEKFGSGTSRIRNTVVLIINAATFQPHRFCGVLAIPITVPTYFKSIFARVMAIFSCMTGQIETINK